LLCDSVPQMHDIEIDQQANRSAAELEIRDHLGLVNRRNSLYRFDLHDHKVFHQQIYPIAKIQLCPAINHRKPDLSFRPDTCLSKFVLQARLIGALKQSGPSSVWTFIAAVITARLTSCALSR
jgi:hypothetical protein